MLDPELITGCDVIDAQHSRILEFMNKFCDAAIVDRKEIANELIAYFDVHLKTEEDFMLEAGYPGYKIHKIEHEQLANFLFSKLPYILNDDWLATSGRSIILALRDHVLTTDKTMAKWIHTHEITQSGLGDDPN